MKKQQAFSSDYIEISSVSEIQTELIRYGEQILQQVHLSKNSSNSAIVRRTKEYIKAHYQDDELCLEQIADALDVNLQYMCFLFKKQTDTTIGAYILQTRMEMAGRLFQRTNYNVTEVAQRVGFSMSVTSVSASKIFRCITETVSECEQQLSKDNLRFYQ